MSGFIKITEQSSHYSHIEQMSVGEILASINNEDKTVAEAVEKAIPELELLVNAIVDKMLAGGRLFYIGSGTSGRLAVVDASELPPTYGVPPDLVVAVIAGGEKAITNAVEFAEDDSEQGWKDLLSHGVTKKDVVIGLSASGNAPYVVGAVKKCKENGIMTGAVVCNPGSPLAAVAGLPVEVVVGPEFITGSTRMKSGTAQKLVLNMISTTVMIKLGRVEDNRMVNMQLANAKLIDRGVRMIMDKLKLSDYQQAKKMLLFHGSVKKAVENY